MSERIIIGIIWLLTGGVWKYNKKILAIAYVISCFLTEFFYIEVFGGCLRIYHLIAVLVLLLEYKTVLTFFKIRIFRILGYFAVVAFITSVLSPDNIYAVKSVLSLYINMMVGIAIVVILTNKWLSLIEVKQVICYSMIFAGVWGAIQFLALIYGKINIGFSVEQRTQIEIGMIPGLSTEANVFGRLMMIVMVLLLPELIKKERQVKGIYCMYMLNLFCTIIDMTRTVVYPAIMVMGLAVVYYLLKRQWKVLRVVGSIMLITCAFAVAIVTSVIPAGGYTKYKITALFSAISISNNAVVENTLTAEEFESDEVITNQNVIALAEQNRIEQNKQEDNEEITDAVIKETNEVNESTNIDAELSNKEQAELKESANLMASQNNWNKEVEDVGYDVSASYRLNTAKAVIQSVFSNIRTILFGNGWGQTYMYVNGIATQAGAGDFINVLAYSGLFGLLLFLLMEGISIVRILIRVWKNRTSGRIIDDEGVLWACLVVGVAGLLSSNIIFPYFWFLIGFIIFIEHRQIN